MLLLLQATVMHIYMMSLFVRLVSQYIKPWLDTHTHTKGNGCFVFFALCTASTISSCQRSVTTWLCCCCC